jgi:hypothetical protein
MRPTVVLFLWWRSRIFVYRKGWIIHSLRHIYFLNGVHTASEVTGLLLLSLFPFLRCAS